MKTKPYKIFTCLLVILLISHCKKNGVNIPNVDHLQFSIAGQTHHLGNLQAYEVTGSGYQMASTVISAHNMVPNDPADVGEAININIFHTAALKTGDIFTTNDITKAGILITYSANNANICTSVPGKQGTVTITDVTSSYIKGTFSVQEFTILDSGGNLSSNPSYTIANGTFYATRQQ